MRAAWGLALALGCGGPPATPGEPAAGGHAEHGPGEHGAEGEDHDHAALPTHVRVSAAVVADAGIVAAPARREVIAPSLVATGQIEADPARTAQVAAKVAGVVESVAFREGDAVKAGQVLARVRAPGLGGLRADVAALQARSASAEANLARLEALSKKGMASQQEIAAARAEATALAAEATAARQRIKALGVGKGATGFELRAPTSGFVTHRGVFEGQAVTPEQTVATIVSLERAWFMARVFEHMLAKVHVGAPAEVELNGYPGQYFAGKIDFLAPAVDPEARTIVARIDIANRDDLLRIGLFGTARIAVPVDGGDEPRLAVPRGALVEVAGETAVFVRHEDGEFELHEVVLGVEGPGLVEVVRGLDEGEPVVVRGAWTLKSVLLKETFGEGHGH